MENIKLLLNEEIKSKSFKWISELTFLLTMQRIFCTACSVVFPSIMTGGFLLRSACTLSLSRETCT